MNTTFQNQDDFGYELIEKDKIDSIFPITTGGKSEQRGKRRRTQLLNQAT